MTQTILQTNQSQVHTDIVGRIRVYFMATNSGDFDDCTKRALVQPFESGSNFEFFFFFAFCCLIHLIKDWERELLTSLSTKLNMYIYKILASFATKVHAEAFSLLPTSPFFRFFILCVGFDVFLIILAETGHSSCHSSLVGCDLCVRGRALKYHSTVMPKVTDCIMIPAEI